jgi:hypothetical protein
VLLYETSSHSSSNAVEEDDSADSDTSDGLGKAFVHAGFQHQNYGERNLANNKR